MSALLIATGVVVTAAVCGGIKGLVWLAGARPARPLPRERSTWMWVW